MQTIEKAEAGVAGPAESASDDKLDSLLRLVEEQSQTSRSNSGKVIVRSQSRLLLVDQKEICFASIEEGTISVVTSAGLGDSDSRALGGVTGKLVPEGAWGVLAAA